MTSPKAISTGVEVLRRTFPGLSTADHATLLESCKMRDYPGGHRFGGVGLGLAIAKNVAERHGGKIEAESAGVAGRGSTFRVTLPGMWMLGGRTNT